MLRAMMEIRALLIRKTASRARAFGRFGKRRSDRLPITDETTSATKARVFLLSWLALWFQTILCDSPPSRGWRAVAENRYSPGAVLTDFHRGTILLTSRQQRPNDTCVLVGQGDRRHIGSSLTSEST
jgi:hypothetical protein